MGDQSPTSAAGADGMARQVFYQDCSGRAGRRHADAKLGVSLSNRPRGVYHDS